jgi:hypothetical protein
MNVNKVKTHPNKHVYLILPREHGNGGCCGEMTICKMSLGRLLKMNPIIEFRDEIDDYISFGPRICLTENMNDFIYVWDNWDGKWKRE